MTAPAMANAFWTVADGVGEIRAEALRDPGPDEVLVRTIQSWLDF